MIEAPCPQYFRSKDAGKDWHLTCKVCGKEFLLAKDSTHPGNLLHLLNHGRSHEKGKTK
jgi:uncharacterized C2H2 Zn-finger protein